VAETLAIGFQESNTDTMPERAGVVLRTILERTFNTLSPSIMAGLSP
jgi:hypothetical protein